MKNKIIFVVQGYDNMDPEGRMTGVVGFEVFATNEKEAIEKAKKYIAKNNYRISGVIEK